MNWIIIFSYLLFSYGVTIIVTQSIGPWRIFYRWRQFTSIISENLGLLFRCQLCFPTNFGIFFSLFNWFLIPINLTPFNIIFDGTNLWWLAAFMDGCLTGGFCHFLWNIDDFFDKNTPVYEDE